MSPQQELRWSDKIGHRGRAAWLLLIHDGRVCAFLGRTIEGVAAVTATAHEKAGKWSNTTYDIVTAPGVRAIAGRDGWETNSFREGLATATSQECKSWGDVARALGVSVVEAMNFLTVFRSKEAERLNQIEEDLDLVDTGPRGGTEITVSFGSPRLREMRDGFWDWPVIVRDETGAVVDTLRAPKYEPTCDFVRVLECTRAPGHHGGYVSLRLAVRDGMTAAHETVPQPHAANAAGPGSALAVALQAHRDATRTDRRAEPTPDARRASMLDAVLIDAQRQVSEIWSGYIPPGFTNMVTWHYAGHSRSSSESIYADGMARVARTDAVIASADGILDFARMCELRRAQHDPPPLLGAEPVDYRASDSIDDD